MLLGIDVGATKLRIGIINKRRVIEAFEEKTERENLLGQIIALINKFDISRIKAIGIGIAGKIKDGIVISSPNIGLKNFNLYKPLKERLHLPIIIENDANCQAISENMYGSARGIKNMIGIFIGTGIGGGIIINGRLIRNSEIGHITIDIDGERCGCGRLGCFEAYASGIALERYAKELGLSCGSASSVSKEAKGGNQKAKDIIKRLGRLIGIGTTNLINTLNPDTVVLGGGVVSQLPELIGIVNEFVKNEAMFPCPIKMASLGRDSGIIGASIFASKIN